jgi:F-type H+-transporting ATPase subunit delta
MIGSVARRYAKAIFTLARDENALEPIGGELARLAAVASDPDTGAALANPLLSPSHRQAIAKTLADQLGLCPTMRNFVGLLADQKRLDQLVGIHQVYERLLDGALGRMRAVITTAADLRPEQKQQLIERLEKMTGKSVLAQLRVDPDLLGGVVLEVEGKVYDGSLRTQLRRLAGTIAGSRAYL